ncbi:MAG: hydrogenase expression/formation protein HypE [Verrucomicrobia bacterium]|nr:hydrogenase expression/formation protein HypE [Verrucomicrobiota bacterium]MBU1910755.1 hydrogenase expression/formation protein HypE [Verrucomicrobiota bacterium]
MNEPTPELVLLSHGGGGGRTKQLLHDIILPALGYDGSEKLDDAACLDVPERDLAITTDSYVVRPLFFPGGDIGRLAVSGTVNDLAMQGAEPRVLTLGLILEEGLELAALQRAMQSVGETAREAGVRIVTGDTKVIERRAGDGLFINTAGLGVRYRGADTHVANARPGDVVLVSGTLGDHGIAVMSAREAWGLETRLPSDVAPLWDMVKSLLDAVPGVRCLRDPTRGGLAAALNDIAEASGVGVRIREEALPVREEVRGACDLLGLDPLNVANEGKAVVVCAAADAARALETLRAHPLGRSAAVIGEVTPAPGGRVLMRTRLGGERMVNVPSGEDLPRIC